LQLGDWLYPQYREVGALFYRGYSIENYIHHMFCNGKDIIKGRQMPNHFGDRALNVVTVSSPIGTKIPHAAGCAYAMKIKKEPTVALVYFGEGAASEGDFHAGLNFAAVRKAPAIFFCRNNRYAISTKSCSQYGGAGVVNKAPGYGIRGLLVDGNDVFAIYHATKVAKEICLSGHGPVLIEAATYRMGAHSTSDDPTRYRPEQEVEQWKERCPIKRLKSYLVKQSLWDEEKDKQLQERLHQETVEAIQAAKKEGPPPLHSLIEDVYEKVPPALEEQLEEIRRVL
jgi:2-oxoisovalerate dehydrogenase E1 component alpha subunit